MNDKILIKAALLGSSSALGYNWIYDKKLMNSIKESKKMIFAPIDHDLYKQAKHAFDVYPNHSVGDLDFMGEMVFVLYDYLNTTLNPSPKGFQDTVYQIIKEDGPYDAYIEAYGTELIKRVESGNTSLPTEYIDKQLIGPAVYFAVKEFFPKGTVKEAVKYASVFTAYKHTSHFLSIIDQIIKDLTQNNSLQHALKNNIKNAPKLYQEALKTATTDISIDEFIKNYSGVACGLDQSFPLIYYILYHTDSWEEALKWNSSLGGASSARGIFISSIRALIDNIPDQYDNILNKNL